MPLVPSPMPDSRIVNYVAGKPDLILCAAAKFRAKSTRVRILFGLLKQIEKDLKEEVQMLEEKQMLRLFTSNDPGGFYHSNESMARMYKTKSETASLRLQEITGLKQRIAVLFDKQI